MSSMRPPGLLEVFLTLPPSTCFPNGQGQSLLEGNYRKGGSNSADLFALIEDSCMIQHVLACILHTVEQTSVLLSRSEYLVFQAMFHSNIICSIALSSAFKS